MVNTLPFHTVKAGSDTRQGFPAALLPLEKPILFLEHQVDVVLLQVVQPDFLFVFSVPQGKLIKPYGNIRVFRHVLKRLVLKGVFLLLSANQPGILCKTKVSV